METPPTTAASTPKWSSSRRRVLGELLHGGGSFADAAFPEAAVVQEDEACPARERGHLGLEHGGREREGVQKEHRKPAAGVPVVEPEASRIKKSHGSGRPLLGPKAGFPGKLAKGPEPRTSHPALSQPPSLPPKLEGALLQVPDQAFAVQLRSIFRSAALTLHQLSDVDLVRYEAPDSGGSWDLALWEELAPVIAQTVTGVNSLVSTVRSELQPKGQGTDLASLLDRTVDEVSDDADAERTADVQRILRRQSDELAALVAQLGERVRTPSVVSDRWNLLAEVQSFRSRFRSEVGNLVYDVASRYSELPRELLVPGYGEDLDAALEVRGALADLRRTVEGRCRALRGAATEDVQWHAAQLGGELDAFGGSAAYRSLRAQDKRFLVEARARLGGLKTDVRGAGDIVLGFAAEFVTSLREPLGGQPAGDAGGARPCRLGGHRCPVGASRGVARRRPGAGRARAGRSGGAGASPLRSGRRAGHLPPRPNTKRRWHGFRLPRRARRWSNSVRCSPGLPTASRTADGHDRPLPVGAAAESELRPRPWSLHRRRWNAHHRGPAPGLHRPRPGAAGPGRGAGGAGDRAALGLRRGMASDVARRRLHR